MWLACGADPLVRTGPPGPVSSLTQADEGVGRGPGGPPPPYDCPRRLLRPGPAVPDRGGLDRPHVLGRLGLLKAAHRRLPGSLASPRRDRQPVARPRRRRG